MKFLICKRDEKISEHASEHALDLAIQRSKIKDVYKVVIPDLQVGDTIHLATGHIFGVILEESEHMYMIKRPKDVERLDYAYITKERLENLYMNKTFLLTV